MNRQQIIEEVLDGRAGWIEADEKGLRAKRIHDLAQEIDACLAAQAQQPQQGAVVEAAYRAGWDALADLLDADVDHLDAGYRGGWDAFWAEHGAHAITPAAPAPAQDAAHRIQPIPQAVASEEACELKTNPCANCGTTMSLRCPGCHPAAWPTHDAPAPSEPTDTERMDGAALIASERHRQQTEEGWAPEHDDAYEDGELLAAALCYMRDPSARVDPDHPCLLPEPEWPWDALWWKPGDRVRELTKAGALIAAEIDRRHRAAMKRQGGGE